jgi:hypothetical protein
MALTNRAKTMSFISTKHYLILPRSIFALILLMGLLQPASAELTFSQLKICTWIEDDAKRLACFDIATDELRNNAGASTIYPNQPAASNLPPSSSSVTRGNSPSQPRFSALPGNSAGRSTQQANDFGLQGSRSPLDEISVNVVETKQSGFGRWIIITEDGQVWRQSDGQKISMAKTPFVAQIERSGFGSHWMQFSRGSRDTKLKVTRDQ